MAEGSPERSARAESGEIATSTLAEIYAQQGLLGRALSIYRRMLARAPEDAEIAARVQSLERRISETGSEPEVVGPPEQRAGRERLPWDPPADDEGAMADVTGEPINSDTTGETPRRVGRIESQAFEAWLEGR